MILYIHGFGGSSEGSTVNLLRKYIDNISVIGLKYDARDPKFAIENLVEQYKYYENFLDYDDFNNDQILLMGSSLGGFYAAQVSAKIGCKLVMFNPALNPIVSLEKYDGETINATDGAHIFKSEYLNRYEPYCGQAIYDTFEKIRMKQFGIQLYTTNDPIIDNRLAPNLCNGFSSHTHFPEINEHRLSESTVVKIKQDVQDYYHAMWG